MSSVDGIRPDYQVTSPYRVLRNGTSAKEAPETAPSPQLFLSPLLSRELTDPQESAGFSALLSGLSTSYGSEEQTATGEAAEGELAQKAETAQAAVQNVSTPAGHASTLAKTVTQGNGAEKVVSTVSKLGRDQDKAASALRRADDVSQGLGKVGESGTLLATPLSVANSGRTLLSKDASAEQKLEAGSTLVSDAAATAKTASAGAADETLSSVGKIAAAQKGLAAKAPGAVSALGKVGKAAPVVGGIASGVSGVLDIKEGLTSGKEVDKGKLVSGGLGVAAGVAMFVPGGQPVAAALGVASLVVDNREAIGKGLKAAGKGVAGGAKAVGEGAAEGAKFVAKGVADRAEAVGDGAAKAASKVADGAKKVGSGAKKVLGKIF